MELTIRISPDEAEITVEKHQWRDRPEDRQ